MKNLMVFVGLFLLSIPQKSFASDFVCPQLPSTGSFTCSGTVRVTNLSELNSYKNNLGITITGSTVAKSLLIDFDPNLTADLIIATPCGIRTSLNIHISSSGNVCLNARKGILIEEGFKYDGKNLNLESGEDVVINKNAIINAQDIKLLSIGTAEINQAFIREGAVVNARHFNIESLNKGFIGKNSIVNLTGSLKIYSHGDEEASIRENAKVEANLIDVNSSVITTIANLAKLIAPEVRLNGQQGCRISSGATITTLARVGNCFLTSSTTEKFSVNKNSGLIPLTIQFNASSIQGATGYIWNFGDNTPIVKTLEPTISHVYTISGHYTASLNYSTEPNYKVPKSAGSINISANPIGAFINCSVNNLLVNCDGLGSYNPELQPLTYTFNFGDGFSETNTTGMSTHAYTTSGFFPVSVTLATLSGFTSVASTNIQILSSANHFPVPVLNCNSLKPNSLSCNSVGSTDSDGTIVSYKYEWGDSLFDTRATETPITHNYISNINRSVKLTVTDEDGGTSSIIKIFSIKANTPPIASFNCEPNYLPKKIKCMSNSSDSDFEDQIVEHKWTLGQGISVSTGASFDSSVANAGTYMVKLEVKDSYGAITVLEKNFTIVDNIAPAIAFQYPTGKIFDSNISQSFYIQVADSEEINFASVTLLVNGTKVPSSKYSIDSINNKVQVHFTHPSIMNLGANTLVLSVQDSSGNTTNGSVIYNLSDELPPQISVMPDSGTHFSSQNGEIVFALENADDIDWNTFSLTLDGDPVETSLYKVIGNKIILNVSSGSLLAEEDNNFVLSVKDSSGNLATKAATYYLDLSSLSFDFVPNTGTKFDLIQNSVSIYPIDSENPLNWNSLKVYWNGTLLSSGQYQIKSNEKKIVVPVQVGLTGDLLKVEMLDNDQKTIVAESKYYLRDTVSPVINFSISDGSQFFNNFTPDVSFDIVDQSEIDYQSLKIILNEKQLPTSQFVINRLTNRVSLKLSNFYKAKVGENKLEVSVSDAENNLGSSAVSFIVMDSQSPSISFSPVPGSSFHTNIVSLIAKISDDSQINWNTLEIRVNNIPAPLLNYYVDNSSLFLNLNEEYSFELGSNIVSVNVEDIWGNKLTSNVVYNLLETRPIQLSFSPDRNTHFKVSNPVVNTIFNFPNNVQWNSLVYKLNDNLIPETKYSKINTNTVRLTLGENFQLLQGVNIVSVEYDDAEGNHLVESLAYFLDDIYAPVINLSPLSGSVASDQNLNFNFNILDAGVINQSSLVVELNGVQLKDSYYSFNDSNSGSGNIKLLPGSNILKLKVKDSKGNLGTTQGTYIFSYKTGPSFKFAPSNWSEFHGGQDHSASIEIKDTSGINSALTSVKLNGVIIPSSKLNWSSFQSSLTVTFDNEIHFKSGTNTIVVSATNMDGQSNSQSVNYRYIDDVSPEIIFAPSSGTSFSNVNNPAIKVKISDLGGVDYNRLELWLNNVKLKNVDYLINQATNEVDLLFTEKKFVSGNNSLEVRAYDIYSNLKTATATYQVIDDLSPVATYIPGSQTTFNSPNQSIKISFSDLSAIDWPTLSLKLNGAEISIDDFARVENELSINVGPNIHFIAGANIINVSVQDILGNILNSSATYIMDDIFPTSFTFSPVSGSELQNINQTVTVTLNDDSEINYSTLSFTLNGLPFPISQFTRNGNLVNLNFSQNFSFRKGLNRIEASIKDEKNNIGKASASYIVTSEITDTDGPIISILPASSSMNIQPATIEINAEDLNGVDFSRVRLMLNEQPVPQANYSINPSLGKIIVTLNQNFKLNLGRNVFTTFLVDKLNNVSGKSTFYDLVTSTLNDINPPVITFSPGGGEVVNLTPNLTVFLSDESGIDFNTIEILYNNAQVDQSIVTLDTLHSKFSIQFNSSFPLSETGLNIIKVRAKDTKGNSGSASIGFDKQNESPNSSTLVVSTNNVAAGNQGEGICYIMEDGHVRCWGRNLAGNAGNGNQDPIGDDETPGSLPFLNIPEPVKEIASASSHSCAITVSGALYCWGTNYNGQKGTYNIPFDDYTPHLVDIGGVVTKVALIGASNTCVILENGNVRCFGIGEFAILGYGVQGFGAQRYDIGDDEAPSTWPEINFGKRVIDISVSNFGACVILEGGEVRCWGTHSWRGHLGYGTDQYEGAYAATVPAVNLPGKAVQIDSSVLSTCAILENGKVYCWGQNYGGELGTGDLTIIGDNETPASTPGVQLPLPAIKVTVGLVHACAILNNFTLRCWGTNSRGQIPDGTPINGISTGQNEIVLGGAVVDVNISSGITYATMSDGTLKAFGSTSDGKLALGYPYPTANTDGPVDILPSNIGGKVKVPTRAPSSVTYTSKSFSSGMTAISSNACAIIDNGKLRCWGYGGNGQLGQGNTGDIGDDEVPSSVPYINIPELVKQVSSGYVHNCATTVTGKLYCWGENTYGEVGTGNGYGIYSTPQLVNIGSDITSVSAGLFRTCAILPNGNARCFGQSAGGQDLNTGYSDSPSLTTEIDFPDNITKISAGYKFTCAILETGKVKCWGINDNGQLGHGSNSYEWLAPGAVPDVALPGKAVGISTNFYNACAVLDTGKVYCWGANETGQLGLGHTDKIGDNETPGSTLGVDLPLPAIKVAVGYEHACALLNNLTVKCWGSSANGELGHGSNQAIGDNELVSSSDIINLDNEVVDVNAGFRSTYVIFKNGTMKAFGYNATGQLGYENSNHTGNTLPNDLPLISLGGVIPIISQSNFIAYFESSQPYGPSPLTVNFDANKSVTNLNSPIVNYHWDFGDEQTSDSTVSQVVHTFNGDGVYNATLTITDSNNNTASYSRSITVGASNNLPFAFFTAAKDYGVAPFNASFNGGNSFDVNGTIANYSWIFGDGNVETTTSSLVNHTYTSPGTYLVMMKVQDNAGGEADAFPLAITIKELNMSPFASFSCETIGKKINCNAHSSGDLDGSIVNYQWDFGDQSQLVGYDKHETGHTFNSDGIYNVNLIITDDTGATSSYQIPITIDSIAPVIIGNLADNVLTDNSSFSLSLIINDSSDVETTVFLNDQVAYSSQDHLIETTLTLTEGLNTVSVISMDINGNKTAKTILSNIVLDTIAPVLAAINPLDGATVTKQVVTISGSYNEKLSALTINDQPVALGADGKSFTYEFTSYTEGVQDLSFAASDLVGNTAFSTSHVDVQIKILYPELISIQFLSNTQLKIIGAPSAVKSLAEVSLSSGFFNSISFTANADGSFETILKYFTSAKIKVTDTSSDRTDSAQLNYNVDTTLAGTIKDTDGNPLPGVKIIMKDTDTPSAMTNASGIFTFNNPPTGDRELIIDAQNVPAAAVGPNKKFSVQQISVSIGTRQANVLETPIYLAPLMYDGSETVIENGVSTTVESSHVADAAIEIPGNVDVTFPEGNTLNAINMTEISKDKTTVPVLKEVEPQTVIALEPSGVTFSKPVELTLPNTNEFPAGMQVLIYSKNSKTGSWEIDGVARVDEDGEKIVTEEGMGITHFSEVYAAPMGLKYSQINSQDKPGADTFNGAVSTSINFPGYKSLGTEIAPKLLYRSNWAHPTATVTNIFNIPDEVIMINTEGKRILKSAPGDLGYIKTWVVPESVDLNFIAGDYHSSKMTLTGIPNQAVVSLGMDFQNQVTGVMPFAANYEIHLKRMTIRGEAKGAGSLLNQKVTIVETPGESFPETIPSELRGQLYIQNKSQSSVGRGWMIGGVQKIVNPGASRIMLEEEDGAISTYVTNDKIQTISKINEGFSGVVAQDSNRIIVSGNESAIYQIDLDDGSKSTILTAPQYSGTYNSSRTYGQYECSAWTKVFGKKICFAHSTRFYCQQMRSNYTLLPTKKFTIPSPSGSGYILATEKGVITFDGGMAGKFKTSPTSDADPSFCTGTATCSNETIYNDFATPTCPSTPESTGLVYDQGFDDGPLGTARFNTIKSLAASKTSNGFAVADYGNHRIRFVNLDTQQISTIAGDGKTEDSGDGGIALDAGLYHPLGVVYDDNGNMYVSTENGYIRKIDTSGKISTIAGNPKGAFYDEAPAINMYLSRPYGLALDQTSNSLFVADSGNHRVLKINLSTGIAKAVAGNGYCQFETPSGETGGALNASLCNPEFISLDDNKNLVIADTGHKLIRRVIFSDSSSGNLKFDSVADDGSVLIRNPNGSFVRTYRSGIKINFDSTGNHISSQDRIGKITTNVYNSTNRLIEQEDPVGGKIFYEYGYSGLLETIRYGVDQREFQLGYDFNKNLDRVTYPDGTVKKFNYQSDGLLLKEIDQKDFETSYVYNEWNRLQEVIRPDGKKIVINDSQSGNMANNYTGGVHGNFKKQGAESNQLVDGIKDAKGITTSFVQDETGYVSIIIDGEGKITEVERDLKGRPIKITRPDDSNVEFIYDNETGDLLSKNDSSTGTIETYEYDVFGNLLAQTDGAGRKFINTFNDKGLLTKATNVILGTSINYSYNTLGQLISQTDSLGHTSKINYNARGNISIAESTEGKLTTFHYHDTGLVEKVTDANNHMSIYEYDEMNRLLAISTGENQKTQYNYQETGELSQTIDPFNKVTSFYYDNLGQLIKKVGIRGEVTEIFYDENGNTKEEKMPSGISKYFYYDNLNQLVRKLLPDEDYSFTYDVRGNVTSVRNLLTKIDLSYQHFDGGDVLSQVHSFGIGNGSGLPNMTLSYNYNNVGEKINMGTPKGSFQYGRDAAGRLKSITNHKGEVFNMKYDLNQKLKEITTPATIATFSFDSSRFNTKISHTRKSGALIENFIYGKDEVGNRISKTTTSGTSTYSFDKNYQLLQATTPALPFENFSYDSIGNRLSDAKSTYIYDQTKQVLQEDYKYLYFFDINGNMTSKQEKGLAGIIENFDYNSENKMKKFRLFKDGVLIKEVNYIYDAFGRRVEKEVIDHEDNVYSYTKRFAYDGSEILFELDESNTITQTFTHSTMRTDDPLSVANAQGTFYFVKDGIGSITDITNDIGLKIQHYEYSSYGVLEKITNNTGVDISSNPILEPFFSYTGREYDRESGLYYYRARYYDPKIGRFLGVDAEAGKITSPITHVNKYIYVGNNPVNNIDPNGKSFKKFIALNLALINPALGVSYINFTDGVLSEKDVRRSTNAYISSQIIAGALYLSPGTAAATLGGTAVSRRNKGNPLDNLHFISEFSLFFSSSYALELTGFTDPTPNNFKEISRGLANKAGFSLLLGTVYGPSDKSGENGFFGSLFIIYNLATM